MYERGKSDGGVVPAKPVNKAARAEAESVEERPPVKGNMASKTRPGRRAGSGALSALDRVRDKARKNQDGASLPGVRLHVGPEAGAQCGSSARWDLCGGPPARAVPTATVVPAKPANKAATAVAESVEERPPAKGNMASKTRPGHRAGPGASSALDRVREVARKPGWCIPS